MKHTKNMIYKPTDESRELYLYAMNKNVIWYNAVEDCLTYARKQKAKNNLDEIKFRDLVYNRVCESANAQYFKDFGYKFDVCARWTCAVDIAKVLIADYL